MCVQPLIHSAGTCGKPLQAPVSGHTRLTAVGKQHTGFAKTGGRVRVCHHRRIRQDIGLRKLLKAPFACLQFGTCCIVTPRELGTLVAVERERVYWRGTASQTPFQVAAKIAGHCCPPCAELQLKDWKLRKAR